MQIEVSKMSASELMELNMRDMNVDEAGRVVSKLIHLGRDAHFSGDPKTAVTIFKDAATKCTKRKPEFAKKGNLYGSSQIRMSTENMIIGNDGVLANLSDVRKNIYGLDIDPEILEWANVGRAEFYRTIKHDHGQAEAILKKIFRRFNGVDRDGLTFARGYFEAGNLRMSGRDQDPNMAKKYLEEGLRIAVALFESSDSEKMTNIYSILDSGYDRTDVGEVVSGILYEIGMVSKRIADCAGTGKKFNISLSDALDALNESSLVADQIKHKPLSYQTNLAKGSVLMTAGKYGDALDPLKKVLSVSKKGNDRRASASASLAIGCCYVHAGDAVNAEKHLAEASVYFLRSKNMSENDMEVLGRAVRTYIDRNNISKIPSLNNLCDRTNGMMKYIIL